MSITWTAYRRARRRSRQVWALLLILAATLAAVLIWFFSSGQFELAEPTVAGPSQAPVYDPAWMKPVVPVLPVPEGHAGDVLEGLPVKGRANSDNYERSAFGQAWQDVDRNGCDTRNDILRRDLAKVEYTQGSACRVASGELHEPYTGHRVEFRRGPESSKALQIDHVVALGDAWQKGAQQLTAQQRQSLANDPVNLIAVDGPENSEKGAGDAATWLPRNKAIRCHYVARQISVKASYQLWVTQAEKDAMKRVLASCPQQATVRPG
ncbi:HNH endonuclease family protein [Arthrobacter sp. ISL-30]|uniref:HNH endonuclease family protein n=1 Tax=Arthrobacter sp. ISL-30 TaxID=2819109 RepID=UPI001BE8AB2B|nr:HNH endonuclease family protein [Arthrobacter sp. ISL-30]MBT2514104.1 HNH endonuclease [Arthrobacter sp. ISL-30]